MYTDEKEPGKSGWWLMEEKEGAILRLEFISREEGMGSGV